MATMAIGGQEMAEMQARPSVRRGASVAERNREPMGDEYLNGVASR